MGSDSAIRGSAESKRSSQPVRRRAQAIVLPGMAAPLDRDLPVPLGVQLRGLIEYSIALGELPPGHRLPSVRHMAEQAGLAPMTVAGVYQELQEQGLIEARPGSGTFVAGTGGGGARQAAIRRLGQAVDALIEAAAAAGLSAAEAATLVSNRTARGGTGRAAPRVLRLVMVGALAGPNRAYANHIARHLDASASIVPVTMAELRSGIPLPEAADLCVTIVNRRAEVQALVPAGMPVLGLSFIPSKETRARLAAIDPEARLGILGAVPEFLASMKQGVLRLTPHVAWVRAVLVSDPGLDALIAESDVIVHGSTAADVRARIPPGKQTIEYRLTPDPRAIREVLLPALERLRAGLPVQDGP
jgi:DNA-binding transcriptional regulator YhcF (GntR family)